MKKVITLCVVVILFCGTTTIKSDKDPLPAKKSAISKLAEIANSMDSTAINLEHSSLGIQKLK